MPDRRMGRQPRWFERFLRSCFARKFGIGAEAYHVLTRVLDLDQDGSCRDGLLVIRARGVRRRLPATLLRTALPLSKIRPLRVGLRSLAPQ